MTRSSAFRRSVAICAIAAGALLGAASAEARPSDYRYHGQSYGYSSKHWAGTSSKTKRHYSARKHRKHYATRKYRKHRVRQVAAAPHQAYAMQQPGYYAQQSFDQPYKVKVQKTQTVPNPIEQIGNAVSNVVAEARRYLGGNPTGRSSLWCARFMNMVLERSGHKTTGSDMARSFASYGRRVSGPQIGAIAVMSRGRRGGHVGVVSGIDSNGNPIVVSGNHSRKVAEATYSKSRIYAYVMPN